MYYFAYFHLILCIFLQKLSIYLHYFYFQITESYFYPEAFQA